jgi:hypothetical protein
MEGTMVKARGNHTAESRRGYGLHHSQGGPRARHEEYGWHLGILFFFVVVFSGFIFIFLL